MTKQLAAAWTTANDRFKARSGNRTSTGVILATLAHLAVFLVFPALSVADVGADAAPAEVLELPPTVVVPPPPEEIRPPARPRMATEVDVDPDVTMEVPDFYGNRGVLPPVPEREDAASPGWVPRDVEPRLTNGAELRDLAKARYPAMLREAGVSATVRVHVYVAEDGSVGNVVVHRTSGYPQLDAIALDLARRGEFRPAMNRDRPVGVWVSLPFAFTAR